MIAFEEKYNFHLHNGFGFEWSWFSSWRKFFYQKINYLPPRQQRQMISKQKETFFTWREIHFTHSSNDGLFFGVDFEYFDIKHSPPNHLSIQHRVYDNCLCSGGLIYHLNDQQMIFIDFMWTFLYFCTFIYLSTTFTSNTNTK